jgi:Skp family chaperone for outer membrane proteins
MMQRRLSLLLLTACALSAGAAHAKTPAPQASAIAVVNGKPITAAQLDGALAQARANGAADSEAVRAAVKNQLIARELFRQEAEKQKLQTDPQVIEARDNAMIQLYLRREIKPAPVSEAQVHAQFDAIVATLGEQEYKPRVIEVTDAALASRLAAQLQTDPAQFAELARSHSSSPSAQRGGELDWVSFKTPVEAGKTQGLPLPIAAAIAGLGAGQVTPEPVAVNGRYYLLKLDEVRPTQVPEYAKAAPALREALERRALEQATAELVTRLLKGARIETPTTKP